MFLGCNFSAPYPHLLVSRALLSRFDRILFVRNANGSPTDSKRQEPCQSLAKGKALGHFDATSNRIPRAYCPISVPGNPRAYCPLWCVSPLMQPLVVWRGKPMHTLVLGLFIRAVNLRWRNEQDPLTICTNEHRKGVPNATSLLATSWTEG